MLRTFTVKKVCKTCSMDNFGIWQEFNTCNDQGKPNRSPAEAAAD